MPGSAPISICPVTVEPSRISAGGRTSPTLTSKVPVTGSAWGATSRTRPIAWTFRLRVRKTSISGSGGARVHDLRRDVEDRVAAVLARHPEDHLARLHDLAGLGAARGDRAGAVGVELGPAQPVLGDVELRLGGVDPRLNGVEGLARLVVAHPGGPAVLEQRLLALVVVLGLDQLPARGRQLRARRPQRVLVVLRIEPGDDLTGGHLVADVHQPLDQPPADAEGEVDLGFRLDGAGQRDGLAAGQLLDGHDPDRTDLGRPPPPRPARRRTRASEPPARAGRARQREACSSGSGMVQTLPGSPSTVRL